eukprot:8205938-Pyramimonas_sp.AAC.1
MAGSWQRREGGQQIESMNDVGQFGASLDGFQVRLMWPAGIVDAVLPPLCPVPYSLPPSSERMTGNGQWDEKPTLVPVAEIA